MCAAKAANDQRQLQVSHLTSAHSDPPATRSVVHKATHVANRGDWRHSPTLSEFRPRFLNGVERSVNRKVQGSNPWSGAKTVEPVSQSRTAFVRWLHGLRLRFHHLQRPAPQVFLVLALVTT